jgi:hypothetical protein
MLNKFQRTPIVYIKNQIKKSKEIIKITIEIYIFIHKNYFQLNTFLRDISVIYSLSDSQIKNFLECLKDHEFEISFPVENMKDKNNFLINALENRYFTIGGKKVVLIKNPLLFITILQYKKGGLYKKETEEKVLKEFFQKKMMYLVQHLVLKILNRIHNLAIYTTISGVESFPIEFKFSKEVRKFTTNVIHYSQSQRPIHKDEAYDISKVDLINGSSLGDIHWVWTDKYAKFLRQVNSNIEYKPVGSIVFHKKTIVKTGYKENKIIIFDVSPQKHVENISFYTSTLLVNFFTDIIEVVHNRFNLKNFELCHKSKRQIGSNHLDSYVNLIESFKNRGEIKLLHWNTNPYELIARSKLIISIPFTSIAHIGVECGTSSIFYYPYTKELRNPIYEDEIPIIYGKNELENYIIKNIT